LVVLGVGMFLAPKKFVESKEVVEKAMVVLFLHTIFYLTLN
jgi:hypothetical protein